MRSTVGLFATFSIASCGLIIDADRFREVEPGASDAPGSITLDPSRLFEGAGGAPGSGRGAVLVVSGGRWAADVEVVSDDSRVSLSRPTVAADGRLLAVEAWLDPFLDLGPGETATVGLTVESGDDRQAVALVVDGLDELAIDGSLTTDALEGPYSDVTTAQDTVLTGSVAARLVSVGRLVIRHRLSVSASGPAPGPGGRAGGESGEPGDGARGGGAGASAPAGCASGGGGAGGRGPGAPARAGAAGAAGPDRPLSVLDLGGHGGGGGGPKARRPGRPGGGGGGVLWLEAPVVRVEAAVEAAGGAGGASDRPGCGVGRGEGSGGGGAGGIVYVKARDVFEATASIDVAGGPALGTNQSAGGAGAPGWIRVDAPVVPAMLDDVWRGAQWATFPRIVSPSEDLRFVAAPGASVTFSVDGRPVENLQADAAGRGVFEAPAEAGRHDLCLVLSSLADDGGYEACISVAVLSQR